MTEKAFCNFSSALVAEIDNMVESLPNLKMAEGFTKDSRTATKLKLNAMPHNTNGSVGQPSAEFSAPAQSQPHPAARPKVS